MTVITLLASWMFSAVALTLMNGARSATLNRDALQRVACLALGLVAVPRFALTSIVFNYPIPYRVGVPLLFALDVIAILTKIHGTVAVFHARRGQPNA